jgi:hypothetical protein
LSQLSIAVSLVAIEQPTVFVIPFVIRRESRLATPDLARHHPSPSSRAHLSLISLPLLRRFPPFSASAAHFIESQSRESLLYAAMGDRDDPH